MSKRFGHSPGKQTSGLGLKRAITNGIKFLLSGVYVLATVLVPIGTFGYFLVFKDSFGLAIIWGYASFIGMDMVCSITEDIASFGYQKATKAIEEKRILKIETQKKKEEKIEKAKRLLIEKNDCNILVKNVRKNNETFREEIKSKEDELPVKVEKGLKNICKRMDELLDTLEFEPEKYHIVKQTFEMYFNEFRRVTSAYLEDIYSSEVKEKELLELIEEFEKYLKYVRNSIEVSEDMRVNTGIKLLVKMMEAEREKG